MLPLGFAAFELEISKIHPNDGHDSSPYFDFDFDGNLV
jgi:hypothetical protein